MYQGYLTNNTVTAYTEPVPKSLWDVTFMDWVGLFLVVSYILTGLYFRFGRRTR